MTVVCIAGMHFSGTSRVARLLGMCGLYLGEESNLFPPSAENPEGFTENYRFFHINEGILSIFNGAWDCPPALEPGWETSPALDGLKYEAGQLIGQMGSRENWGWKDPRNSLTIPFWNQLIPAPKVIVCLRHPEEVALSLADRGGSSRPFSLGLWQSYSTSLVRHIQGMDWLLTHYDSYFQDPEAELLRLLEFLEMKVSGEEIRDACRNVDRHSKHNRAAVRGFDSLQDFPVVQTLYGELCSHAGRVYESIIENSGQVTEMEIPIAPQEGVDRQSRDDSKLVKDSRARLIESMEKVRTLEGENEDLVAQAVELSGIKHSRSWRFITRLQKLRLKMLPIGSRRERLLYALLRLPRWMDSSGEGLQEARSSINGFVPPAAGPSVPVGPLKAMKTHDTAVILHLFYPRMWQEFCTYLLNFADHIDLYITAPHETELPEARIRDQFPGAQIYRFENRGRDIAPFLAVFSAIEGLGYKFLCKLHTKKSPQIEGGSEWRQDILEKLLGSSERILRIQNEFDKNSNLGIIAPKGHVVPHTYFWRRNAARVSSLAGKLRIRMPDSGFLYPAGSMFWFRPVALAPILQADLSAADFEPETGQLDGTLAHAIERLFGLITLSGGYELAESGLDRIEPPEISFQFRMALWVLEQRESEIRDLSVRLLDR